MSKKKQTMAVVAIMLTNIAVMCYANPAQVIADVLYTMFPESSVNFMLTGPSLLFGVCSLLAPWLIAKLGARNVLILGVVLTGIGGIFGVTIQNAGYMVFMTSLMGVGSGLANVSGVSLIHNLYADDENKNAKMIGYYNAAMAIIGAAMSYIIGILCVSHWTNGWKIYWISVVELILCLVCIPGEAKKNTQETVAAEKGTTAVRLKPSFFIQMTGFFFFSLLYYGPFIMMVSLAVSEWGLGDSSVAGLAYSLSTIGSFLFSLVFGYVFPKIRRFAVTSACFVAGGCLLVLVFAPSTLMLYAIEIISGFAFSLIYNWSFTYTVEGMDEKTANLAFGIVLCLNTVGSFLTSYLSTFLMEKMQCGFTQVIPVFCAGFFAVGIIDLFFAFRDTKLSKKKA